MVEKIYKIEFETSENNENGQFALWRPILKNDVKLNLQALLADYDDFADYENKTKTNLLCREMESRIYCILTNTERFSLDEILNEISEENQDVQKNEKKEKWRRNRKRKRTNKDEHVTGKRRKSCLDMTINRKSMLPSFYD